MKKVGSIETYFRGEMYHGYCGGERPVVAEKGERERERERERKREKGT